MSDPFAAALDAQFLAPGSVAGIYLPEGYADGVEMRMIVSQPDAVASFGERGRIIEATCVIQVRREDVPEPKIGDRCQIGDVEYVTIADAMLDVEALTWTLPVEPAEAA